MYRWPQHTHALTCLPLNFTFHSRHFNFIIERMVFPSLWKKVHIFPLTKTKDLQNYPDLRPVSILCWVSKVLEKIIKYKNILPTTQSSFPKGHSCATALLNVTDDSFSAQYQNKLTLLVLLGYPKAFDRIKVQYRIK